MSKKSSGGSSAPAATPQDPMQQLSALQSLGGMGGGGGGNNPDEYSQQRRPTDLATLFPALAQLQDFRTGITDQGTDMRKQALAGILKMFGGG